MSWLPNYVRPPAGWLVAALLTGCGAWGPPDSAAGGPAPLYCRDTYPQASEQMMCTMEYQPVCAQMADGGQRTFSNDCHACSGGAASYVAGHCDHQAAEPGPRR